jgi:hypothetical protein
MDGKMKAPVLLALLLVCGAARASEWVLVGKSSGGSMDVLVDISSIKVAGDVRRAWIRYVPAAHTVTGSGISKEKWVKYSQSHDLYNCVEESSMIDSIYYLFEDGSVEATSKDEPGTHWSPVPPDTMTYLTMRFTCSWKPK